MSLKTSGQPNQWDKGERERDLHPCAFNFVRFCRETPARIEKAKRNKRKKTKSFLHFRAQETAMMSITTNAAAQLVKQTSTKSKFFFNIENC